ncbi:MAG: DMT family transporter [Alphaproteobacteria bacterium]|nr:DMT family transporter [Alphaproteobacteria bacterium]MBF0249560.1 DMT family transporter [Alphaproteobacteria bacterium]
MPTLARDMILMLILAVMWSSSFTAIKVGADALPPTTFAMLRVVIAAVVIFAWLKIARRRLTADPRLWLSFLLIGLFGNVIPFILINWGEQEIPSGLAAILIAVMPISALLLGRLMADEILNVRRAVGIFLGFAGVVVLIGPEELLALGDNVMRQLAVAGAAVCYAIAAILVRKLPTAKPTEHGTGVLIASAAVLVALSVAIDRPWILDYDFDALAAAAYLGVFPTALATLFLMIVVASRGVTFLALNNYLIPVLGVAWGYLFLDEPVGGDAAVALVLILAGVALAGGGPGTRKDLARETA